MPIRVKVQLEHRYVPFLRQERRMFLDKTFEPIGVPSRSCPNLILHLCTKMTNEHRLSKLKKGTKILFRIRLK